MGSPDAVVRSILDAVADALPTSVGTAGVKQKIRRYGRMAAPALTFIPVVGAAVKGAVVQGLDSFADDDSLQKLSDDIVETLGRLDQRVLVVVDDVDRLQPDELVALFKAVRVLGRLPPVHYLLAYDEQTVLDVLSSAVHGRTVQVTIIKCHAGRLSWSPSLPTSMW